MDREEQTFPEIGSGNQTTTDETPARRCLNCETALTDKFCSHCGQRDLPPKQTMGELFSNFISSFWSFESKFFATGRYLLFKPGQLAKDFNEGKRERYYHPARMYVFISFIYFLLLTTLPEQDEKVTESPASTAEKEVGTIDAGKGTTVDISFGEFKSVEQYDSAQATLPPDKRDSWIERKIAIQSIYLGQKYEGKSGEFEANFKNSFLENLPKVFFFLLPVFALLLKLLYVRRNVLLSEHLVFSVFYYNFFFLAGIFYMIIDLTPYLEYVNLVLVAWIFIYLLLAMKRMYGQPWGKTVGKYFLLVLSFMLCVLAGIMINLAFTMMTI